MKEEVKFDVEKLVNEFRQYLNDNYFYFNHIKSEAGFEVDQLSYFISSQGFSNARLTDYIKLEYLHLYFRHSEKFKEQYLYEALELIFKEFEEYSNVNIDWIRDNIFPHFSSKRFIKNEENKLLGALVYQLVKQGASQKNAIDFVSAVSGVTATVIRDSYYETRKFIDDFGVQPLASKEIIKIEIYLKANHNNFEKISRNPKFSKSANALEKLKKHIETTIGLRAQLMIQVRNDIEKLRASEE